jgi:GDP-D-mannose dehydratase
MTTGRMALIAGSTGIVGGNFAALLVEQGWTVYGLARRPLPLEPRMNDSAQRWKALAAKHGLAEPDVNQLVIRKGNGNASKRVCARAIEPSKIRRVCYDVSLGDARTSSKFPKKQ